MNDPLAGLEFVLSVGAFAAFFVLLLRRSEKHAHNGPPLRRLLFVDGLLVIAAGEIVFDAGASLAGHETDLGGALNLVALMLRGALIAGGLALLTAPDPADAKSHEDHGGTPEPHEKQPEHSLDQPKRVLRAAGAGHVVAAGTPVRRAQRAK